MNMKTNFNIIKNSLQKYDPDSQCVVLVFIRSGVIKTKVVP